MKLFITGINGCVGNYLADLLINDPKYELFLLVNNTEKLRIDPSRSPNVHIIKDDLRNIRDHADLLKEMEMVVHLAAGWGISEINYECTIDLFKALDPARIKKIIYFSTASILGPDNKVNEKVGEIGTSYIKGKYDCHKKMPELPVYDRIITLFPTWVLGGDKTHRYSHAMQGLIAAKKWLWLLRFLSFDLKFHFIHAKDIAVMVKYLLDNEVKEREFVLGNEAVTADQVIQENCDHYGVRRFMKIRISPNILKGAAFLLGKRISEWDRYCLLQDSFVYQVTDPRSFGLIPSYPTIASMLE